jgi:hypothetical protein
MLPAGPVSSTSSTSKLAGSIGRSKLNSIAPSGAARVPEVAETTRAPPS